MHNFKPDKPSFSPKLFSWTLSFLLGVASTNLLGQVVQASSPQTAPPQLQALISQIEASANSKDIEQLMQFYSPEFKSADGLNSNVLAQALTQMWQTYPNLKYTINLQSWEQVGDELMAETMTSIEGTRNEEGRTIQIKSTIKSRQYFQNQKLVRQEILAERTQLSSGSNPPEVEVMLPQSVKVGEEFDFDVIVKKPLGDSLLAGAALEEQVDGDRYLKPGTLELEVLQAGGLFKRAKAPTTPQDYWLSAILARGDGITLITQRVNVEK